MRTYVALANTSKEGGTSREALQSGEQSIHTILKEIKDNFDKTSELASSKILVPLQQLGREHWVLLAIETKKQESDIASMNTQPQTTATYHDSKDAIIGTMRNWGDGESMATIEEAVKGHFGSDIQVRREYSGKQVWFDNNNCGRHTLEKLVEIMKNSFCGSNT